MPNNTTGSAAASSSSSYPHMDSARTSPPYEGSAYSLPPPPAPYCHSPSSSSSSSAPHEDMAAGPPPQMMYLPPGLGPDQLPQIIQHYAPPYYGPPPDYKRMNQRGPLRKGKWTHEEEVYAHSIIDNFNKGLIDLPRGTTLRSYLSEMLNCDPMRVTKKFSGTSCIGKSVFCPCEPTPDNIELIKSVGRRLAELHKRFMAKVEASSGPSGIDSILRSMGRQWLAPIPLTKYNMNYNMPHGGAENEAYMANNNSNYHQSFHAPPPPNYPPPGAYEAYDQEMNQEEEQEQAPDMLPPPPRSSSRHAHGNNTHPRTGSRRPPLPRPTRRPYPGNEEEDDGEDLLDREEGEEEVVVRREEPPMDDKDAGDLLVNFFASVRKNYGSDGSCDEGEDEEGGSKAADKAPANKRVKVDEGEAVEGQNVEASYSLSI